ncbi:MAG: hypothetical protein GC164_16095 [Phycisphaera sp.]|nr:hypothetical protein [Phycisphaera sp.]
MLSTTDPTASQAMESFNLSPALFVQNQGQWADDSVHFLHNGNGVNVAMTDTGPVFQVFRPVDDGTDQTTDVTDDPFSLLDPLHDFEPTPMEMKQFSVSFVGANTVTPVGFEPSESTFNYFVGDESLHRSEVPAYEGVMYEGLYDGVDLLTWGQRDSLKYEFHIAPGVGSDYSQVQVHYDGIAGLSIADDGALQVDLGDDWSPIVDDAPYIYQVIDGQQVQVPGRFTLLSADTYGFEVTGRYDPTHELVIDPDLAWSSYLGGPDNESGDAIAADSAGNLYITGWTGGGWISGGFDTSHNGSGDAFVAKVNANGTLAWSSYLGGSNWDWGFGVTVDSAGNIYLTGWTESSGWTSGGFDTSFNGGYDAFVAKVNANGTLAWSSYLGGSSEDKGSGIAVDGTGNIYFTGVTWSSGWTSGGFDTSHNGSGDAFVAKVNANGTLAWSSYLGGSSEDIGSGIAVDSTGNVYLTGNTWSGGWTSGGFDTYRNGNSDAFVAKINANGTLAWSSYLGGRDSDYGYGIAVDSAGNIYFTGETWSTGWTSGGFDTSFNGGYDAFVAKVNANGTLAWSSYLGGSSEDNGSGIAVDSAGNIYFTGETWSTGWTSGGFDTSYNGSGDAFVAKVNANGTLAWSSYLGGSDWDYSKGITVDRGDNIYLTGYTKSSGWTSGGFDTSHNGYDDAFVAKITDVVDAGDGLANATNLATLVAGSSIVLSDQIGNGIYGAKDIDLYKFTVSQTGTVTLDVDAQSTGSSLDAYLRLFNSVGVEIRWSDDTHGLDPYISLLLAPGTYYAGVSGYANRYYNANTAGSGVAGSTGPYTLTVSLGGVSGGSWTPIIAAQAEYDGNPDPSKFGRYLVGSLVEDVVNTFTAFVSAPTGFTTSAVRFDANFNGVMDAGDYTDLAAGNGWTWDLNVSNLTGDKTLRIWAQESGGAWSDAAVFTIDTLAAPAWMDPDLTTVTFNASAGRYEIDSLIGQRFGVDTPSSWPEWLAERDGEPTFNGIYFGTLVEATAGLDGRVRTQSIAQAFGWSVFGFGQTYKAPGDVDGSGFGYSVTLDLFRFMDLWQDPTGYFNANQDHRVKGFYDRRSIAPQVTLTYQGEASLGNNLQFTEFEQSFIVELMVNDHPLIGIPIPPVIFPLWAPPDISLVLTPQLGFSPYFEVNYTQGLGVSGLPEFESVSTEIGIKGEVGVTGELAIIGGIAKGGVDVTGSVNVGINATYNSGWTYSIPAEIGVDIDFVGSILWGVFTGRLDVWDWSTSTNLWSSGGASAATSLMAAETIGFSDPVFGLAPIDHAMGRSGTGDLAYAYVPVSLDGAAQPLAVQRLVGGAWQTPEVVSDSNNHRGTPAIVSLGGDDWMVVWSQSNLPTDNLAGLNGDQVMAEQELWFSIRSGGVWSTPAQLTADSVCDDSPSLVRLSDGTVVAAWRRMSGTDVSDRSLSDIAYATWNGASWSGIGTLADTASGLSQVSLAVLTDDRIVATWTADASDTGQDVTVWSALFDGSVWSTAIEITDGQGSVRTWSGLAALSDGSAVAIWTKEDETGVALWYAMGSDEGSGWTWSTPMTATEPLAVLSDPKVLADGQTVRVVYHTYGDENEIVGISRDFSNDGSSWESLELLTPESGQAGWPVAAVDTNGDVQVRYIRDLSEVSTAVSTHADLLVDVDSFSLVTDPAVPDVANGIQVVILNEGWTASTATTVSFFEGDPNSGGMLVTSEALSALAVGESTEVVLAWTPTTGSHNLWVVVDPADSVAEADEANNAYSQQVPVLDPPTLVLDTSSDTGTPGDNRTVDSTPTFVGTATDGMTLQLFVADTDSPLVSVAVSGSTYLQTLPQLSSGSHTVWARLADTAGGFSTFSSPVVIFIDPATLPVPDAPTLDPASDTGTIGDGVTSVRRPVILGAAKPSSTVQLYDGVSLLGEVVTGTNGSFSFTPADDIADGLHEITICQTDVAGNASETSEALSLTISDTVTPTTKTDFNADGYDDIVFRNSSNGLNIIWLMQGATKVGSVGLPTVADTNWTIAAIGDMDMDGDPDLVWRNDSTGLNIIWTMNGTTKSGSVGLPTVADTHYEIVGLGDFNADDKNDLVWRNTSNGSNIVWTMNGTTKSGSAGLPSVADTNWQIVGIDDFNDDDKPDLLWRNTSNGLDIIWTMNGTSKSGSVGLPTLANSNWILAGVLDSNMDGHPDLLWRNQTSGLTIVWTMTGTSKSGSLGLPTVNSVWVAVV